MGYVVISEIPISSRMVTTFRSKTGKIKLSGNGNKVPERSREETRQGSVVMGSSEPLILKSIPVPSLRACGPIGPIPSQHLTTPKGRTWLLFPDETPGLKSLSFQGLGLHHTRL